MDKHKEEMENYDMETCEMEEHEMEEFEMEEDMISLVKTDKSFDTLEKEFQKVYSELIPEKSLEKFTVQYKKLFRSLKIIRENEKKLLTENKGLKTEIMSTSVKLEAAMNRSLEDQATIIKLQSDIDQAKTLMDEALEKEERDNNTIKTLQQKVDHFNNLIAEEALLTPDQVHRVEDLLNNKEQLTAERDNLLSELKTFQENFNKATNNLHEAEEANMKGQDIIRQLQQDLQVCRDECSKETQEKSHLENELKQCHADIQAQRSEMKKLNAECKNKTEETKRMGKELRNQMALRGTVSKELEQLKDCYTKLQNKNKQNSLTIKRLESKNADMDSDLKTAKSEANKKQQEIAQLNKVRDTAQSKLCIVEKQKVMVEQQRETLKNQNTGLQKRVEKAQKQSEDDKNKIQELTQEKGMLTKKLVKSENAATKQLDLLKQHEQTLKNLDKDILKYRENAQKQSKVITQLEKERASNITEANKLKEKVLVYKESTKTQEMKINECKQNIAEGHKKILKQQNMYDAMSVECHITKKNLHNVQNELTELKHKVMSMSEEKDELKEIIKSKETALANKNLEFEHMEKKNGKLQAELQKMEQQAQQAKQCIQDHEVEKHRLLKLISDADAEKAQLRKELDRVRHGRDNLSVQLVQRSEELAQLSDKSNVQAAILKKGESEYNKRMEDISLLKKEASKLHDVNTVCKSMSKNMEQLCEEVSVTQKEMFRERARRKKLQEQLEHPLNVHRWRKLEATDPDTFKLTQKIHTLQRSLRTKTEEVAKKELQLQEKEKLYAKLEQKLARQPAQDLLKKLEDYERKMRTMSKQLKLLTVERNMYMAKAEDYEKTIKSFKRTKKF